MEERAERERAYAQPPSTSAPPPTRGEIAQVLDIQEKATHELLQVVKVLAQKLGPVLAPAPENAKDGGEGTGYGSQIANCVQGNTVRVRQASQQLASLVRDLAV